MTPSAYVTWLKPEKARCGLLPAAGCPTSKDEMLRFALVRAVEIIGEAASRVSAETRSTAPSVPWGDAITMRNRLVHAYFDVDLTILWKTATEDIPALLALVRPLLAQN